MASNFDLVDTLAGYIVGGTYTFMYNDKLRKVLVERCCKGNNVKQGGHSDYLHCNVLEEEGEVLTNEVFKNFTISKIQH